jgi:hypothetical protein
MILTFLVEIPPRRRKVVRTFLGGSWPQVKLIVLGRPTIRNGARID